MEPVLNAQSPYLADLNSPFPSAAPSSAAPRALKVELARSLEAVRAAQRLRYAVFAGEMGAKLHNWRPGLDHDRLDPFCQHLIVRDGFGQVVGCTRILTAEAARRAGGFYSEREFDLTPVLALPGTFMEIGRTCVHPDYRNGATIGTLWSGLAAFVAEHAIDYLIGCASIPAGGNGAAARALRRTGAALSGRGGVAGAAAPALPRHDGLAHPASSPPPLLKAYLRLGAKISGEPCLDPDFNVADVLILLPTRHIERRYARHFLDRDL
ncbi:MAG: GNAT family N-acetyltransferase [Candidatus Competibacteraceae bacterium]|nr:GNAT family N-acetyltransferase [Candidatus Competibacteraceae bacterium]